MKTPNELVAEYTRLGLYKRGRTKYGASATIDVFVTHPKNRMRITGQKMSLWQMRRDTTDLLFRVPGGKAFTKVFWVNDKKAKLVSVSSDNTARFELI